jgi:hypothetical protein
MRSSDVYGGRKQVEIFGMDVNCDVSIILWYVCDCTEFTHI